MPPVGSATLLTLEENPREIYLEVTSVLLRLASNVIKNPSEPKFRSIRLANPTVVNKLLPAVGAMECLFEMGFQEAGDCLVLPTSSSLENLKKIHDEMFTRRNKVATLSSSSLGAVSKSTSGATSQAARSQDASTPSSSTASDKRNVGPSQKTNTSAVTKAAASTASEQQNVKEASGSKTHFTPKPGFLERIVAASEVVSRSHNKELLDLAKSYVPVTELETAALEQLRKIQMVIKKEQAEKNQNVAAEPSMQELVLIQLLAWFKERFFSWVNNPSCHFCSGKTKFQRTISRDDIRVEVYECAVCFQSTDFPRHTDPMKLLETRRGRCGEWGRCFTFLCLALGWDSRLVIDETDHVWTEVFLTAQSRWVHCDPCENAYDSPLMYELGWNKKLSYIMAYTHDNVQDVTWRYSANHKEILRRRKYCSEEQLLETIMSLRKRLQQNLSSARKEYLLKRTLFELVELWKEPSQKDGVYQGRQSGSLAWRLSRGETTVSVSEPYVWKPTPLEIESRKLCIKYVPGLDQYLRGSDIFLTGWQNGVNTIQSIFRKEEKDWNMVYLAREEGSEVGKVSWSIDLTGSGFVAESVELTLSSKVFESGQVTALICGGDSCVKLPTEMSITTTALAGASIIKVNVDLCGGVGNVAWQHAQLFRAELGSNQVGLDLIVTLKSA
ncbi:peptide-N(4)-(N-acetyl-beta-glucosaminyl)asparagine amidase [Thrips palmi]|uniref:Peptide-N(4)-(N-acetyl-beta-glucosaminyl)asparagine amidase n=1 Tax=Thrips palmi TaxID=161013 RepID=A0A6P8Z406_THRPL|nr:peptide-N(4)-(N-acetyl-beta-glucosaminyl)asparagine amidase [Thrips palmi]